MAAELGHQGLEVGQLALVVLKGHHRGPAGFPGGPGRRQAGEAADDQGRKLQRAARLDLIDEGAVEVEEQRVDRH
ncbi:hypothetical protein D3C72_2169970 [compost metagenome]